MLFINLIVYRQFLGSGPLQNVIRHEMAASEKTDTKSNCSTFCGTVPQKVTQFQNFWNGSPKIGTRAYNKQ